MEELLNTNSIKTYHDAIFSFAYMLRSNEKNIASIPIQLLLRPFNWFKHDDRMFEDVFFTITGCMPIYHAYIIATADKPEHSFTKNEIKKSIDLLTKYTDGRGFTNEVYQDQLTLIQVPNDLIEQIKKVNNLLTISTEIIEQEQSLKNQDIPALKAVMDLDVIHRLEYYEEIIQAVINSRNCVCNILRNKGDKILTIIEKNIYTLLPADQDYILHALDAFPNNSDVIKLYNRFLENNENEILTKHVKIYLERVESGMHTTGKEVI